MKIVGRPVWKWTLVDRPPMSQRSHIASSGRTAIWPCSVACSAPSRTSGGSAAGPASSSPSTYQSAWVGKFCLRQVERDHVDHLVVGEALALEGDHLLGHRDLAEGELEPIRTDATVDRRASRRSAR